MKKTLLTLLGTLFFGNFALSQIDVDSINKKYILNKINNERKFNMNENDPYCVDFKLYKDRNCIIEDYDLDFNGKVDLKARYRFSANGYQNALVVFVDENEDFVPELVYLNTNNKSFGTLNDPMTYEQYLDYLSLVKNTELGRERIKLKPLKIIQPKL